MMSHKSQAVVLTYHRVPEGNSGKSKFHDLPFDHFRKQMEEVAGRAQSKGTKPNVCITFDDGTSDHFRAGNLLSELGLTGTFFIVTGKVGKEGYLSRDQVVQLAQKGHRIGSHTVSHPHLTKLSAAELDKELIASKLFLEELTLQTVDWLAPPGGIYNQLVLERAHALGYSVVRTMEWGYPDWPFQGRIPCFPVLPVSRPDAFGRILDGNASVWPFVVKNGLKSLIGDVMYNKLRNKLSRFQQSIRN
jgi:peptidoglycan/xylan/chitin deacetylase (PgdA/CDA1 family)